MNTAEDFDSTRLRLDFNWMTTKNLGPLETEKLKSIKTIEINSSVLQQHGAVTSISPTLEVLQTTVE